ncbi:unnamed protein product [Brassica oleracea var. botrytis]
MAGFRPRLSEYEKEKGVASSLSPSIDQSSGPKLLGVAARAQRDISCDVVDLIVGRLDGAVNIPDNLGKTTRLSVAILICLVFAWRTMEERPSRSTREIGPSILNPPRWSRSV